MELNRILFAGMHESGKTTFIAALWDYVNSEKVEKKLTLYSLADSENQYLEKIRAEWLQCKKVTRTNLNESETVRMNVRNSIDSKNLILEIPDISGELFNNHFQFREWDTDYDNIVSQMKGILLFINPKDKRNRTQFIADANAIELEIESELNEEPDIVESETSLHSNTEIIKEPVVISPIDFAKWSEEYTSNQVKLVETLQLIASRIVIHTQIRISVVISRWDLIELNGGGTPETWLQTKMPLLHQYLICNEDIYKLQVYGVSAQGGEYKIEKKRKHLLAIEPHERVQVKFENTFINDITAPITWLTENLK